MMKPEFSIKKQKNGNRQVLVKGDLIVQHSPAFKQMLTGLLSAQGEITISLSAVESIDISSVQLLSAFRKKLKQQKGALTIAWPEKQPIDELIAKTGIKQLITIN